MNLSEGRDLAVLARLGDASGRDLLDVHTDPDHHRSVFTMVGEQAPRAVAALAVELVDLRRHEGVHPRFGMVDVVPFVPLRDAVLADAVRARDDFARWAAATLDVPCFLYGPLPSRSGGPPGLERTLPEVRRGAFRTLVPDLGPPVPHRSAGAMAVGARPLLVAYNLWLTEPDLDRARAIATAIRSPQLRTLGLAVGDHVMVSCNLVDPVALGPAQAWDQVAEHAAIARAELVGLVPEAVLRATPEARWAPLDLAPDRTIEARLVAAGY